MGVEFYSMLKTTGFLLSIALLTSCSFYSSAGRKQFEEKAPASIQAFSLQSCHELGAAETWFKEEFPSSTYELVEINQDYEVWGKSMESGHVEVTVLSKPDAKTTESCIYKFESKQVWSTYKKSFLDELARSPVNID